MDMWQLSRNPPSNLSGLLFESFRAVGLQNRTVFEQQNRSTKGVLQIWWSRNRSIPKVKQCCLRKTKSQVLEDFSTVGKVKSRVQEVILDRKYQLGIIRKLDSHSQIVFYFLKSKSLKSSTKAFCEGFFDHFEQNSHHFWPTRSCSSTSRHELRARSSFSARANNYGGLKINTNCFNGTHSTRSWSSTFRHELRTRSNLSARQTIMRD